MWLEVADPDGGPSEAKSAMHHINWPEGPTVDQRSDGVKRRRRRGRGIGIGIESFVRLFYCSSLSSAAADDAAAAGVWLAGPGHWCGKAEVRPPSGLSFGLVCAIITSLPEPSQQPAASSQPASQPLTQPVHRSSICLSSLPCTIGALLMAVGPISPLLSPFLAALADG